MGLHPIKFTKVINEESTTRFQATIKDETGQAVPAGSLSALTLTLSNVADGSIINSRNGQNVLNQNNVTVDSNGLLTYTLQPADTAIQDDTLAYETHRATFHCEWNAGAGVFNEDIDFLIRNLSKVS